MFEISQVGPVRPRSHQELARLRALAKPQERLHKHTTRQMTHSSHPARTQASRRMGLQLLRCWQRVSRTAHSWRSARTAASCSWRSFPLACRVARSRRRLRRRRQRRKRWWYSRSSWAGNRRRSSSQLQVRVPDIAPIIPLPRHGHQQRAVEAVITYPDVLSMSARACTLQA